MGNLLQYTDKSSTIDNKLNSLLSQINYDYNNGNIRTETEYYYRIKNMLSEFYNSLTKPTLCAHNFDQYGVSCTIPPDTFCCVFHIRVALGFNRR